MSLLRLHRLVRDHRGPLRADLRREYGIDLDAVLRDGSVSSSVLLDLIDGLSPQAALWRAMDPDHRWGISEHLLALVVDELRLLRYAWTGGTRPRPIPRPGVDDERETETLARSDGFDTPAEFWAWHQEVNRGN